MFQQFASSCRRRDYWSYVQLLGKVAAVVLRASAQTSETSPWIDPVALRAGNHFEIMIKRNQHHILQLVGFP